MSIAPLEALPDVDIEDHDWPWLACNARLILRPPSLMRPMLAEPCTRAAEHRVVTACTGCPDMRHMFLCDHCHETLLDQRMHCMQCHHVVFEAHVL